SPCRRYTRPACGWPTLSGSRASPASRAPRKMKKGKETTMSEELSQEFIDGYTSLLLSSWTNEDERARLLEDPAAYAVAKGLPVEAGAVVRVDETPHDGLFTQS